VTSNRLKGYSSILSLSKKGDYGGAQLYDRLAKTKSQRLKETAPAHANCLLEAPEISEDLPLIRERTREPAALGLTKREQDLVSSLVETRIYLNDGNVGHPPCALPG
jgi:hypothetical protein